MTTAAQSRALSPHNPATRAPMALLALLWLLAAVGLAVLGYRFVAGLGVTRLGTVVPWGAWVSFYIFFIGLSAGSFLLSTLIFVFRMEKLEPVGRLALLQAFACLALGMAFIFIDLGHWGRAWHIMVYPQWGSILAWESWLYVGYLAIIAGETWLLMRCDLSQWAKATRGLPARIYRTLAFGFQCPADAAGKADCDRRAAMHIRLLALIGIPVALGVHGGTGAIFAVVKARPGWNGPLFPLVFIVSALVSGGGLLMFLRAFVMPDPRTDRETMPLIAKLTVGFLVFDLTLMLLEFLVGIYGGIPDHLAVFRRIAVGPFWYIFWILQLLIGAAIPLLILFRKSGYHPKRMGVAGLLIVAGILGVRMNIVIPALSVPVFRGYDIAINSARMNWLYVPNWIEWLSSLGVIAAAALVFLWAVRRLPMSEHQPYSGAE
jgi:molybdopterin-containing oxidoreductase family membrane subunit